MGKHWLQIWLHELTMFSVEEIGGALCRRTLLYAVIFSLP